MDPNGCSLRYGVYFKYQQNRCECEILDNLCFLSPVLPDFLCPLFAKRHPTLLPFGHLKNLEGKENRMKVGACARVSIFGVHKHSGVVLKNMATSSSTYTP